MPKDPLVISVGQRCETCVLWVFDHESGPMTELSPWGKCRAPGGPHFTKYTANPVSCPARQGVLVVKRRTDV